MKRKGTLRADYAARLEALPGWVWAVNDSKWEEGFGYLMAYANEYGTALVPARFRYRDYSLGSWVPIQRDSYRAGTLSRERACRLEALPGWSWDPNAEKWDRAFSLLAKYAAEHGTSRAPQDYVVDGVQLGSWIGTQKGQHAKGKLDPVRQRRLNELPGWTWNLSHDVWEERFALLKMFAVREGHARVPQKHVEEGEPLGVFVSIQRRDGQNNVLASERRKRLEALPGWAWNVSSAMWEQNYGLLVEYTRKNKTSRVPFNTQVDGAKLGQWVYLQRGAYARGKLDTERQSRLEKLAGWTWKAD